jgi:hypothetical protein
MPRGGARKGAGRKRGIPNVRKRAAIVKDLVARGEDPLTYFLSIMKDENESTERRDWAAAQAAPYVHPRLQSIDQRTTLRGDTLSEVMKAIDGRTTGIATGAESVGGSPLAPVKPVQHH